MVYHLTLSLRNNGIPITQVYNRSKRGLDELHNSIRCHKTTSLDQINGDADLYIISISDDATDQIANKLTVRNKEAVVCHTSGNLSMDVFQDKFDHYGVFYPLQSVRRERPITFSEVPIFITGNSKLAEKRLTNLGQKISNVVRVINDDDRSKLHIPAVMVNNFVNFLYSRSFDYCIKEGLEFSYLIPLMEETLDRIKTGRHPSEFQTGPAIRGDHQTIKNHRRSLRFDKDLHNLYNYLTKQISEYHYENSQ